jgi:hypothetical protein
LRLRLEFIQETTETMKRAKSLSEAIKEGEGRNEEGHEFIRGDQERRRRVALDEIYR